MPELKYYCVNFRCSNHFGLSNKRFIYKKLKSSMFTFFNLINWILSSPHGRIFCTIQSVNELTRVYTPGHPAMPHGDGPNDTMPAQYQYGRLEFVLSIVIRGPPESPRQESNPFSPPAHSWVDAKDTLCWLYTWLHWLRLTPLTPTFSFWVLADAVL